jgi:hypothetical protein
MAEDRLQLRAIYRSGDFDRYWEFHIEQDQRRLYPPGPSFQSSHTQIKNENFHPTAHASRVGRRWWYKLLFLIFAF